MRRPQESQVIKAKNPQLGYVSASRPLGRTLSLGLAVLISALLLSAGVSSGNGKTLHLTAVVKKAKLTGPGKTAMKETAVVLALRSGSKPAGTLKLTCSNSIPTLCRSNQPNSRVKGLGSKLFIFVQWVLSATGVTHMAKGTVSRSAVTVATITFKTQPLDKRPGMPKLPHQFPVVIHVK